MNWTDIILAVIGLCSTGGFIYLLVDKKVLSKKELAEAQSTQKENQKADIHTGLEALNFYQEIDSLIKQHTDPLNDKIDELTDKVNKWCCYRNCEVRLRDEEQAKTQPSIKIEDFLKYM